MLTVGPQSEERPERGETLAERLERGPLPLSIAVRHAYDIAKAVRHLHKNGQAHGSVNGRAIELRRDGAVLLLPAGGLLPESACGSDIRGFGWVLRSLFPDEPPPGPPGSSPASPGAPLPGTSAEGVWEAARQLAARCLADPPETGWTAQKLVSELRLLDVIARQWASKAQSQAAHPPPDPKIWRAAGPKLEREPPPLSLAPPTPAPPPPAQAATPPSAMEFRRAARKPHILQVQCPRCGGLDVHPSTPRTDFEETLELWRMPVLRCRWCSYRYFRFLFLNIRKEA